MLQLIKKLNEMINKNTEMDKAEKEKPKNCLQNLQTFYGNINPPDDD